MTTGTRCDSHGAVGGQNIGPGYTKVEAAKRELGTRVNVKIAWCVARIESLPKAKVPEVVERGISEKE